MSVGEILFYEVIISSGIFLIFNSIIYLILKEGLKDYHKLFLVMCLISCFYFQPMNVLNFLVYIIFILIFIIILKKAIYFNLEKLVTLIFFIILFLFSLIYFFIFTPHTTLYCL